MQSLGGARMVRIAYLIGALILLRGVAKYWERDTGFTSMIRFGSVFEAQALDVLNDVPHIVLSDSHGYDGQFYVQLALSPTLADPQLPRAIDNLAYRGRRIFFSWTAWLLGLGQPRWIVQAYALQNVLTWIGTALLLCHWLPPTTWFHFFRWAGLLFSSGMLTSLGGALLDGPALFLLLASVWLAERGWHKASLALLGISALGKETNLLGAGAVARWPAEPGNRWRRLACGVALLTIPLALWLSYIRCYFDTSHWSGERNFALPLVGWLAKFEELVRDVRREGWFPYRWMNALCVFSLFVQFGYFLCRWHIDDSWWRLGAPFAILGLCLGMAVLEGFPGAYTRSLLPLQAAFNLSLGQSTRARWTLLALGNLGVFQGLEAIRLL